MVPLAPSRLESTNEKPLGVCRGVVVVVSRILFLLPRLLQNCLDSVGEEGTDTEIEKFFFTLVPKNQGVAWLDKWSFSRIADGLG